MHRIHISIFLLLIITACTGQPDGQNKAGGGNGNMPVNNNVKEPQVFPKTNSPLRRLTHDQINNSLSQLFPKYWQYYDLGTEKETAGLIDDASDQVVPIALAEKYFELAIQLSEKASQDAIGFTSCSEVIEDNCIKQFIGRFGEKIFRKPLTNEIQLRYFELYKNVSEKFSDQEGLESVLQAMILSPDFLYMLESSSTEENETRLNSFEIASRLSYLLWNDMPDDELFNSAKRGELSNPDDRLAQFNRMLKDPRAKNTVNKLHKQWLGLLNKESLARHIDDSEDVAQLKLDNTLDFMSRWFFENSDFSDLYNSPIATDAEPDLVNSPEVNAGILASRALLASHAERGTPAPILRGTFVISRLLCSGVPPVPPDAPEAPMPDDNQSTRDWLAEHRENGSCAGCHNLLDPYGLVFENFDDEGRYRLIDGGSVVDASAELLPVGDLKGPVSDLEEFSSSMAKSITARSCAAEYWYRTAMGRQVNNDDKAYLEYLTNAWIAEGGSSLTALKKLVASDLFITRINR